ncbi:beta-ketoacyl-ACP synthase II [Myxococcota bacterium]|nr:beta-ketoacyl-ACP synthase II [Myxococcota bacterium]
MRRVVVTGLGALSPCGLNLGDNWSSMVEGRSGIGPITRFDPTGWPVRFAGEVKGFDPDAAVGKKEARRMDRFCQLAIAAADEAAQHAGLPGAKLDPERFGVYVGTGIGGIEEIFAGHSDFVSQGWKGLSPFFIPKALTNLAAGHIAMRHNAQGPSLCVSTACASGNHSLGEAWRVIRQGDADVILAGGAEAAITPTAFAGFMVMKALSKFNDDPARASRPFDADRDGFVMGEGAAVLVLESLEHAQARGATIYGEILGYGLTNDAHHLTAPAPGGRGAAGCMRMALRSAGLNPSDVQYINAHGTSTPQNDSTETTAIRAVFGDHADKLMVSSTKAVTGHLLGAAGGIEAVATVLALHHGVVPPTATWETPDPECDLDYVPKTAREVPIRRAISNSFGFGGTNASVVFGRFES